MINKIIHMLTFPLLIIMFMAVEAVYSQNSNETSDFYYGKELYDDNLYDLAAIQFNEFLEKYPSSPNLGLASFLLAESYFFSQKISQAKDAYIKFIINFPSHQNLPQALYRIGECYEQQQNREDALTSFLRLENTHIDNPWYFKGLLKAASLSIELQKFVQSESILNTLINANPEGEFISQTWLLYSQLYYAQKKYKKSIDILETVLKKSIPPEQKCSIELRLGEIYQDIGLLEKSIEHYQKVTAIQTVPEYTQQAFFHLGEINAVKGKNELALQNFQNIIQISRDTELKIRTLLKSGDIYLHKDDFNSSLSSFNAALTLDSLNHQARFGKALSLLGLNKIQPAEKIFTALLQDSLISSSLEKRILLHCAALAYQNKTVAKMIAYLDAYLTAYPHDKLKDIILLKKGKVCLQNGLWDEGYYSLRKIWKEYPKSQYIPEARFIYAKGLEQVGRYREAQSLYSFIVDNYPQSSWQEESEKRGQWINTFIDKDYDKGLLKLSTVMIQDKNNPDYKFALGKIYFYDFKNYKKAVNIFQTLLAADTTFPDTGELYYLLGKSYENLFLYYNQDDYRDSAGYYYQKNLDKTDQSFFSLKSRLSLADLLSSISLKESLSLVSKYPIETLSDSLQYEFRYRRAQYLYKSDSLKQALPWYTTVSKNAVFSQYKEPSLFKMGKIQYTLQSYEKADSLFSLYQSQYKSGLYLPAVLFCQARIQESLQKYSQSIINYTSLEEKYFYSVFRDSALRYLGNLYLKTGNYPQAIDLYTRILLQDSLLQVAVSTGLIEKKVDSENLKEYLFGLAKSYQCNDNLNKAQHIYLKYGKSFNSHQDKIRYYTALATLAEQRTDSLRAVEYLNHLFTLQPNDSVAAALGNLLLRMKKYDRAREIFNQGLSVSTSDSIKCLLSSRIIISMLKEKKIPQADVRIDLFNQSFKNYDYREKYLAEFYLEKGKAYIEEKDFDAALKFLYKVDNRDKYPHLVPQAKFQIGRVYLITNKTDKALDILTYLTENYKNHPIAFKVYLNLGYHYYQSQQYQNAIHALKIASSSSDNQIKKTAWRILIKIYEENGLIDNALKVTRDYMDQFPHAPDILQQKIKVGTLLMQLHEYDRAIEQLKSLKVYTDAESEARIQYWIAKSYYNMGQFRKAIFEFLKVKYLSQPTKLPWKTTAMYEASNAYIKLQEYDKAEDLLKKLIQIEGTTSSMGRFAVDKLEEIKSRK